MDTIQIPPQVIDPDRQPETVDSLTPEQKKSLIWVIITFVILLLITIGAIIFLLTCTNGDGYPNSRYFYYFYGYPIHFDGPGSCYIDYPDGAIN